METPRPSLLTRISHAGVVFWLISAWRYLQGPLVQREECGASGGLSDPYKLIGDKVEVYAEPVSEPLDLRPKRAS
jgi:hypothetical protein